LYSLHFGTKISQLVPRCALPLVPAIATDGNLFLFEFHLEGNDKLNYSTIGTNSNPKKQTNKYFSAKTTLRRYGTGFI
jgi:hypothetical protein